MNTETDTQIRLRRAKDALAQYRETENAARKALADACQSTKAARERYDALFLAEEQEEVKRLRSEHRHATS